MSTYRSPTAATAALLLFVGVAACGALGQEGLTGTTPQPPVAAAPTDDAAAGGPPAAAAANDNNAPLALPAEQGNALAPTPPQAAAEGALGLYVGNVLVAARDPNFGAGSTLRPGTGLDDAAARLSYHGGQLVAGGKTCLAARQVPGADVTLASCTDGNALSWSFHYQGALAYRYRGGGSVRLTSLAWAGCARPSATNANCRLVVTTWGDVQADTNTRIEAPVAGVALHPVRSPNLCLTAQGTKLTTQVCAAANGNQLWQGFAGKSVYGRGTPMQAGSGACLMAAKVANAPVASVGDCGQAPTYWYLFFGALRTDDVVGLSNAIVELGADTSLSTLSTQGKHYENALWTIGPVPTG